MALVGKEMPDLLLRGENDGLDASLVATIKAEVVKKAEKSQAAQATKRTTQKATDAVKSGASRTAAVIRDAGNKLNEKIPPGPNDAKK